jgi:hypothetical protein
MWNDDFCQHVNIIKKIKLNYFLIDKKKLKNDIQVLKID